MDIQTVALRGKLDSSRSGAQWLVFGAPDRTSRANVTDTTGAALEGVTLDKSGLDWEQSVYNGGEVVERRAYLHSSSIPAVIAFLADACEGLTECTVAVSIGPPPHDGPSDQYLLILGRPATEELRAQAKTAWAREYGVRR